MALLWWKIDNVVNYPRNGEALLYHYHGCGHWLGPTKIWYKLTDFSVIFFFFFFFKFLNKSLLLVIFTFFAKAAPTYPYYLEYTPVVHKYALRKYSLRTVENVHVAYFILVYFI